MSATDSLATRVRSATGSGPADFQQFDRETQQESFRGLAVAAFVYAAAYFLAYGSSFLFAGPSGGAPPPESLAVAALSIVGSIVIGWGAWTRRLPTRAFCPISQGYAVLGSLGIAASTTHWKEAFESEWAFVGVPWIAVWILVYPTAVTLSPKQVVKMGILSTLTIPLVVAVSLGRSGLPIVNGEPSARVVIDGLMPFIVSTLICVGIATYMSSRIWSMTRDISKARLMGNYELVDKLGEGGMGEVWRARHRLLARPAAVKLIRPSALGAGPGSSGQVTLRRFEREAMATAALTSPHTVSLFDFGVNDEGTFYYVMELLEGMDLRTLVEKDGPLPPERAIHFLRQACASLGDAHSSGLIHRDIKPANLFICRRGLRYDFLKVLDFGLVKGTDRRESAGSQLTVEGLASGTPAYMAPEMATDQPIDGRADVYALGCVAYWLLCGQLVFDGDTSISMLMKHVQEEPIAPSARSEQAVDAELEQIVLQCLAKRPDDRPASAVGLDGSLAEIERRLGEWTQERAERWWRARLPNLVAASIPVAAGLDTA